MERNGIGAQGLGLAGSLAHRAGIERELDATGCKHRIHDLGQSRILAGIIDRRCDLDHVAAVISLEGDALFGSFDRDGRAGGDGAHPIDQGEREQDVCGFAANCLHARRRAEAVRCPGGGFTGGDVHQNCGVGERDIRGGAAANTEQVKQVLTVDRQNLL